MLRCAHDACLELEPEQLVTLFGYRADTGDAGTGGSGSGSCRGRRGTPKAAPVAEPPPPLRPLGPRAAVSWKLAQKVQQQLRNVASVMGGCPTWVGTLLTTCKFLFPFDVRRQYLYCTALGVSRAMMWLVT